MKFDRALLEGRLIKRYKRFLADVRLPDGSEVTVHCANSGSMATCDFPGRPVLISDAGNPRRKLRYTWELIDIDNTWIGVNTSVPNTAVAHFVATRQVPELCGYATTRREVRYGTEGSRIDLLLQGPGQPDCYVEVKNCTMRVGEYIAFPDATTLRGQKHLRELTAMVAQGQRAVMFYFLGRSDCRAFRPADEIDPYYGALLREAVAQGVEALAYRMHYTPSGVQLLERLPVDLTAAAPSTALQATTLRARRAKTTHAAGGIL